MSRNIAVFMKAQGSSVTDLSNTLGRLLGVTFDHDVTKEDPIAQACVLGFFLHLTTTEGLVDNLGIDFEHYSHYLSLNDRIQLRDSEAALNCRIHLARYLATVIAERLHVDCMVIDDLQRVVAVIRTAGQDKVSG